MHGCPTAKLQIYFETVTKAWDNNVPAELIMNLLYKFSLFLFLSVCDLVAKETGLVNQVVPADQLMDATYEMAREIAEGPPVAIAMSKAMIYQALETSLDIHGRLEFFAQDYCFNTGDREEGIRSFLEKRPPHFKGE